jgi:predicted transglutaminase-like cysteine proteinase
MYAKTLGAAFVGLLVVAGSPALAGALHKPASAAEAAFVPVYGRTLPPIGFVEFCARNRARCERLGSTRHVALTEARWQRLHEVNTRVNASIEPVSDQDLYAVPERWDYPVDAGDCEDYVLLKKRTLEELDFPSDSLLITVVLDEVGEGHAVLTVSTDRGDFVLDNRRNEILHWTETRYLFLKRQSQEDPRIWLALSEAGKTSVVEAAGKDAK